MLKIVSKKMSKSDILKAKPHRFNVRRNETDIRTGLKADIMEQWSPPIRSGREDLPVAVLVDGVYHLIAGWHRALVLQDIAKTHGGRFTELVTEGISWNVATGTDSDLIHAACDNDKAQVKWTVCQSFDAYVLMIAEGHGQMAACQGGGFKGRNSRMVALAKCDADFITAWREDQQAKGGPVMDQEAIGKVAKLATADEKANPVGFAKGERSDEYKAAADALIDAAKSGVAVTKATMLTSKQVLNLVRIVTESKYNGPISKADLIGLLTAITGYDPTSGKACDTNPATAVVGLILTAKPQVVSKQAKVKAKA